MSNPCCPPGSWQGLPLDPSGPCKGSLLTLSESQTPAYYSPPPPFQTCNKGIVVFTDVWGFSPRIKSICDALSSCGYHVIMPDCFRGDTKGNHENEFVEWLKTVPYDTVVAPDIAACNDFLSSKGVTVLGCMGFCWGAWAVAKSAAEGVKWKVGVGVHPSTKIEHKVFDQDEAAMMKRTKIPLLLLPASNDADNLKPGGSMVQMLENGKSILFQDMVHGWVTRGDLSDEKVERDAQAALTHVLAFFSAHLK